MRMKTVKKEELAAMDAESDRCALELSDARVDVLGYACLVAIMSMGHGYHRQLAGAPAVPAPPRTAALAPVVTSAGALVDALKVMGAKRIALVAPYMKPLTELVVDYIRARGHRSDATGVRSRSPTTWRSAAMTRPACRASWPAMNTQRRRCRSCCRPACRCRRCRSVAKVEAMTGKPVVTAAIATTYAMLKALDLEPVVPGGGALLSGAY